MKPLRTARGPLAYVRLAMLAGIHRFGLVAPASPGPASPSSGEPPGADVPCEFHRRIAAIIQTVQVAIWQRGVHELLGYATDYALGQQGGVQTLVLKTRSRSAYLRVQWDTVMGTRPEDRDLVDSAVRSAIVQLA